MAPTGMSDARKAELKKILEGRQRELQAAVGGKIREVRTAGQDRRNNRNGPVDLEESIGEDGQEEIELALVQMKAETLRQVNDALIRLEASDYGYCFECSDEIAEKRLRALPFAVRCKECQSAFEHQEARKRQLDAHRTSIPIFDLDV